MPARSAVTPRRRRTARSKASAGRRTAARRRSRRRRGRTGAAVITAIAVPVVLVALVVLGGSALAGTFATAFSDDRDAVATVPVVEPAVAGYGPAQLDNACTILAAGRDLGFGERDQAIAVMTAMGESSLRNIDYGDWETSGATNPDGSRTTSIGLFQQQDSWGPREARLDPYSASTMFYRAMADRAPDRDAMEPTLVAHRVQINADPLHYARYWDRALRVVAAVTGSADEGDRIDGIPHCP